MMYRLLRVGAEASAGGPGRLSRICVTAIGLAAVLSGCSSTPMARVDAPATAVAKPAETVAPPAADTKPEPIAEDADALATATSEAAVTVAPLAETPKTEAAAPEPLAIATPAAQVAAAEPPPAEPVLPTDDVASEPPVAPEDVVVPPVEESGAMEALPPVAVPPASQCPCRPQPAPAPAQKRISDPGGRLVPATWRELPDWSSDQLATTMQAFMRSCAVIDRQARWQRVCAVGASLRRKSGDYELRGFFEKEFNPYRLVNGNGATTGLITGYYQPLLFGSLTRSERYRFPLYRPPYDLVSVDFSSINPEFKNKRVRGRMHGNRVVPYFTRAEIESFDTPLKGRELVWVDDPLDAFFLQIEGSGRVQLDTGDVMHVGYADQNGHPYRSVSTYLVEKGELQREESTMPGIRAWARANPEKVAGVLNSNPSYVFFRELPKDLSGPPGALGVPLTPERSIAVDRRLIPLGAPVYVSSTWPDTNERFSRLMVAQDTGGAIRGAVRADVFLGTGDLAERRAGTMSQGGQMWVLLPKSSANARKSRQ